MDVVGATARDVLRGALTITAFVAAMMVAIEYVNVQTRGLWIRAIGRTRARQYLLAATLGALPGCLGAFVVVALFAHGRLTIGAVVAAMIATSGDETFVMLALFPGVAVGLTLGLAAVGVGAGAATDALLGRRVSHGARCQEDFALHGRAEDDCRCLPAFAAIGAAWRPPRPWRATTSVAAALFAAGLATGAVGPAAWGWERVTFLGLSLFALFIFATVPDHFLEEHLWRHVLRVHVPRLFLWTAGALALVAVLEATIDLSAVVADNRWLVLLAAVLVGIVPESGPHLVFVTLYAAGALPLSVLVASSATQDGHGMLPMLAHSRRDFLLVKGVNVVVGAALGAILLALGL